MTFAGNLLHRSDRTTDRVPASSLHFPADSGDVRVVSLQQYNVGTTLTFKCLTVCLSLVWAVSISYILLLNTFPLRDMKDWLFPDYHSQMHEGYLTSVLMAWINARCVSFCLDRFWQRVEREPSLVTAFTMLTAFCFYLPLGVMGPLVTSKKFKESSQKAGRPLGPQLLSDTVTGSVRYLAWLTLTDISTYFTFQQAFTYHVSTTVYSTQYTVRRTIVTASLSSLT